MLAVKLAIESLTPKPNELNDTTQRQIWMQRIEQFQDLFDRVLTSGSTMNYGTACSETLADLM